MSISIRNNPIVKAALTPFSWLYGGITDLRNAGFDSGRLESHQPHCLTISVGNLTVGGTGKTPMIELLIRLLRGQYKIAVVSRGYGRKSKGLIVADENSTADDIGDEPLQFYRKFAGDIRVIVAESRALAAQKIEFDFPDINLILLDDAYQHRAIKRDLNILLSDYYRPFYEDAPFPAGNLRERRKGAARADLTVVTKCPAHLTPEEQKVITDSIRLYTNKETPVFFSSIKYGALVPFLQDHSIAEFQSRVALAGLAQNGPFEKFVRTTYQTINFNGFPDHHSYSVEDLQSLELSSTPKKALITTEKDMVKLAPLARELSVEKQCFYVPIETNLFDLKSFQDAILSGIASHAPRSKR